MITVDKNKLALCGNNPNPIISNAIAMSTDGSLRFRGSSGRPRDGATGEDRPSSPAATEKELSKQDRINAISGKLHSLIWVILAGLVLYWTDLPRKALHDPGVNRNYFSLAVLCVSANFVIFIYCTLYLPLVRKVHIDLSIYCPNVIALSTFLAVASMVLFMISFWALYGALTPFIILLLTMGLILSFQFIPWPC